MPDESKAATEHVLLQEITAPLASLPDDPVPEVADVDFPIVLRGYDRLAVDAYVKRTSQLVAELQATRSPEAAVRRGLERVGEEVAGILQRAHEAASQITAQSRSEAEDRLERARQESTQLTAGAERRLQELDAETDRIWAERQRIVEDAQQLAQQLLTLARSAAERFPADEDPETTESGSRLSGMGRAGGASPLDELDAAGFSEGSNGVVEDASGMGEGQEAGGRGGFGEMLDDIGEESEGHEPEAQGREAEDGEAEERDPDDPETTRIMPPIRPPEDAEGP